MQTPRRPIEVCWAGCHVHGGQEFSQSLRMDGLDAAMAASLKKEFETLVLERQDQFL